MKSGDYYLVRRNGNIIILSEWSISFWQEQQMFYVSFRTDMVLVLKHLWRMRIILQFLLWTLHDNNKNTSRIRTPFWSSCRLDHIRGAFLKLFQKLLDLSFWNGVSVQGQFWMLLLPAPHTSHLLQCRRTLESGRLLGSALQWAQKRNVSSILWNISWGLRNPKPDPGVPPSMTNLWKQHGGVATGRKNISQTSHVPPPCLLYIPNYSCNYPSNSHLSKFCFFYSNKTGKVKMGKCFKANTLHCLNYTPI